MEVQTVYKGRKKKTIEYFAIKSVDKSQKSKVLQEVSRTLSVSSFSNLIRVLNSIFWSDLCLYLFKSGLHFFWYWELELILSCWNYHVWLWESWISFLLPMAKPGTVAVFLPLQWLISLDIMIIWRTNDLTVFFPFFSCVFWWFFFIDFFCR